MKSPAPLRNADRTRALILDAAERVFERDGWQNATMSAIGAEAGVSRGTPGYFFASKAGLRAAMCQRLFDGARAAATGLQLAGDSRDQAIALLHGQLAVAAARPALARLAVEHWAGARVHAESADDVAFAALERDLIRRIRELIESVPGRLAGPETGRSAAALLSLAWSAALPNAPGGSATSGAALADQKAFISALVHKLFDDNVGSVVKDAGMAVDEGSLTASKLRNWRLPGVG